MKILIISSDANLREVLKFCFDGWGYEVILSEAASGDIAPIKRLSPDVIVIDVHAARRTDLEICELLKDDFITSCIPVITLIDKRQLRNQLLNIKQGVDDYLIKPPDPLDLRVRVEMAIKRLQYSFYSTPLTGLPGGKLIEENLRGRLKSAVPFSFGYLDLDHFKYYNDTYGYVKGDRIIMQTAYILYSTILAHGNHNDFIGHIGGDDFAFITTPDRMEAICDNFIATFNKLVPFHYTKEDRERGYIVARGRDRVVRNVPLVSVSIAVVSSNRYGQFRNVIEINERIAEIKRYLKGFEGSKFMADRRAGPGGGKRLPRLHRIRCEPSDAFRPLGQVLLERGVMTAEKLDDALIAHWRRGIPLGEVAMELGLAKKGDIDAALREQSAKS
ncbi:MAG: diguanylate cyclase [Candidatus Omnitrophica bacterium]|nr:diguanylate cyclase [Candidatus Omnitrophota bacterium]